MKSIAPRRILAPCALALALALGFGACARKTGEEGDEVYDSVSGTPVEGGEYGTPLAERQAGTSYLSGNVQQNAFPPIYFAYDSFAIEAGELAKVRQVADQLFTRRSDVIIAGFTDERGTEEYNRALGERRALAVREALISQGIKPARLQTVSFGEDMPAQSGNGESVWAANRRAEFGLVK
jgi:peptidoglycan-associated lipoprotein